jgi:hypothetical protein
LYNPFFIPLGFARKFIASKSYIAKAALRSPRERIRFTKIYRVKLREKRTEKRRRAKGKKIAKRKKM